jgi:hypothetical protein
MTDEYRKDRIERLLKELEYEINRGMMEGEIGEDMSFRFWVPVSKSIPDGVVACEFRTRPVPFYMYSPLDNPEGPRLKVVK